MGGSPPVGAKHLRLRRTIARIGQNADGFVLYVGTARSINALDYFNGDGPLHVPEAVVVTDEVVAQAQ